MLNFKTLIGEFVAIYREASCSVTFHEIPTYRMVVISNIILNSDLTHAMRGCMFE